MGEKQLLRTPQTLKESKSKRQQKGLSVIVKCEIYLRKPLTIKYYTEDCGYFMAHTDVEYIDEVNHDVMEDFIFQEMENGKKVSSLNTHIRGLRVFFNFCAERDYMNGFDFPLIKQDKEIKEPYTDAELKKLLARPRSSSWVEWRMWAAVNYMAGTGNRVSTVLNIRIRDIDFMGHLSDITRHAESVKHRRTFSVSPV